MQIRLGEIQTDLLTLPGFPGRHFVKQATVLAAYRDGPSAATIKRRAQAGRLVSVQPGGPNTLVYIEVMNVGGDRWEPVWLV